MPGLGANLKALSLIRQFFIYQAAQNARQRANASGQPCARPLSLRALLRPLRGFRAANEGRPTPRPDYRDA